MAKGDFEPGSATVEQFFWWINERHRIYEKRAAGLPPPWTEDEILRTRKFTNVFRQLDRGTVFLREKCFRPLLGEWDAAGPISSIRDEFVFNTIMYRMLNYWPTFEETGFVNLANPGRNCDWSDIRSRLLARADRGEKMFTSCHMTVGAPGERKIDTHVETFDEVWYHIADITDTLVEQTTLEGAFKRLLAWKIYGIGKFIAYEIISDLRWTPILDTATDKLSWANIGPGCARGLRRLGLPVELGSLQHLYEIAPTWLEPHVLKHYPGIGDAGHYPPFEMREIEHCLCEFDKYCRGGGKERFRP